MDEVEAQHTHSRTDKPKGASFVLKVTFAFVAISLMTILVSVAILAVVWGTSFDNYTRDNMQRLANSTAASISKEYDRSGGDWYGGALAAASSASSLYDTVYISVTDENGAVIFNDGHQMHPDIFTVAPKAGETASAPITAAGEQVGTVYIQVHGSDNLLTQPDAEFRDATYRAVGFATLIAAVVALIAGVIYARVLVKPIRKITRAANELTEGNFSVRTNLRGNDEISQLGETFDLMVDSIEQSRKLERQLVTDVAHELRTPLMAIQATVEAMVDGVFEPNQERLTTLNSEVQRLSRLVDALMKLSRLENRTTPINRQRTDAVELIQTIVSSHEAYVTDAGLQLKFEHDPEVWVFGDPDMLRQACANLISNSVRYTPEGGTITVSVRKGSKMGKIAVRDTGIGLSEEEAKMVFARFWRADPGRARATGGLGIGLSVVKEIVDQHNGWVNVEGKPNEGACFTIYIPLFDEKRYNS